MYEIDGCLYREDKHTGNSRRMTKAELDHQVEKSLRTAIEYEVKRPSLSELALRKAQWYESFMPKAPLAPIVPRGRGRR